MLVEEQAEMFHHVRLFTQTLRNADSLPEPLAGSTRSAARIVVPDNNHIVKICIIAEFAGQDVAPGIQVMLRYGCAIKRTARRRLVTYHAR
ncbi:hypothetical protein AYI70_g6092 [Smittium culicis]|uniref:Uncharacterized protein n=1 Tax=Smittium culicis TaxID=133412 RepID=A0A1R1XRI5_9FUNG|nr:hypothetical protein AYI70_g6092 [Smittium culicis]